VTFAGDPEDRTEPGVDDPQPAATSAITAAIPTTA